MLMLGKKLSWEKCTAKTSVAMIGQQVESHLPRLLHGMVFLQFAQFMHGVYEAKAELVKCFRPHQKISPKTNFEVK